MNSDYPTKSSSGCSSLTDDVAQDEMLTKGELAAKLKVTIRTIENWQRDGFLPYIKISSVVLFHWPEVLEHLKANFKVCRRGVLHSRNSVGVG